MKNLTNNAKNRVRIIIAAAAVCATLGGAARADEAPQVNVKYADLNLGTTAGATALYQRIRRAANEVCPATDDRELPAKAVAKACADQAVARAVATVDNVNLTKVYEAELGTTVGIALAAR
jgi:UrcA family protein